VPTLLELVWEAGRVRWNGFGIGCAARALAAVSSATSFALPTCGTDSTVSRVDATAWTTRWGCTMRFWRAHTRLLRVSNRCRDQDGRRDPKDSAVVMSLLDWLSMLHVEIGRIESCGQVWTGQSQGRRRRSWVGADPWVDWSVM